MTVPYAASSVRRPNHHGLTAAVAAALLVGACSSSGDPGAGLESLLGPAQTTASSQAGGGSSPQVARTDLEKALEYWGEEHKKKPTDANVALSYSRNLKAAGRKEQAFGVLQSVAIVHGENRDIASEMGRLALEFDQVPIAEKLLAMADDPAKPDWRVISARGTVMAKQNKYAEAIPYFERASSLAPTQASVLNNLAMAHAANGDPAKAEEILRKASATSKDPKIRQNLALVLGLQGKHDEAGQVRSAAAPSTVASADTEYIKQMVRATPGQTPAAAPAVLTAPAQNRPAPQARVTEAKGNARPRNQEPLRTTGGPAEVGGPTGAWSTSVSTAR